MPHAGARGSTATNGHESDDADDAFEDAEPPPTSSPANPYPSRSDFEAARRNLTRAVSPTPQPQPAAAASTQPGLEEQLAAAKDALAKARDESSTEPVYLTDKSGRAVELLGVRAFPTSIVLQDGEVVASLEGAVSAGRYLSWLETNVATNHASASP